MRVKYVTEFAAQESADDKDKDIITINGKAVYENISLNRVKYEAKELEKAAPTLINKPLMTDHVNSVNNVIGKVTAAWYDAAQKAVMFTAEVYKKLLDEKLLTRILKGLVNKVSIGADVAKVAYKKIGEDLIRIVKGITFVELSLVAVPGNSDADFTKAKGDFGQAICEMLDKDEVKNMEEIEELKKQLADAKKVNEQLEADKDKAEADKDKAEADATKAADDATKAADDATKAAGDAEAEAEKLKGEIKAEKEAAEKVQKDLSEAKDKAHTELVKKVAEAKVGAKLAEKVEDEIKALSEKSDDVLSEILSTVEQVKPTEEKPEVKGKVAPTSETEESDDDFVVERGANGLMSIYEMPSKGEE